MMNAPNIICFISDQQRADHLGCAGNPDLKTPHIDSLAADGLRFNRSYVSNPVCSPNRASIFTGQYPKAHGLRENGTALPADAVTLPKVLRENGYQTFSSGKLHLSPYGVGVKHEVPDFWRREAKENWDAENDCLTTPYHGLEKVYFVGGHGHYNFGEHRNSLRRENPEFSDGYLREHAAEDSGLDEDVWCSDLPADRHYNADIADHFIDFLANRDQSKPFFGWCSFPDPHHPFSPPEPYYSMYSGSGITVDPAPDEGDDHLPRELQECKQALRTNDVNLPEAIAKNYGMISMIDAQVGRVVAWLKENDLYENTIIVYLSDHGDYMGDHGMLRKGVFPYEGLYRIPTIWRIPDYERVRGVTESLHGCVDVMPTLLELAGVGIPKTVQGVSQADVLRGNETLARDCVYAEFDESLRGQRVRYLRDDQYAFAYLYGAEFGMLHDMQSDPKQQNNLFNDPEYQDVKERFLRQLADISVRSDPWHPEKVTHA